MSIPTWVNDLFDHYQSLQTWLLSLNPGATRDEAIKRQLKSISDFDRDPYMILIWNLLVERVLRLSDDEIPYSDFICDYMVKIFNLDIEWSILLIRLLAGLTRKSDLTPRLRLEIESWKHIQMDPGICCDLHTFFAPDYISFHILVLALVQAIRHIPLDWPLNREELEERLNGPLIQAILFSIH